MTSETLRLPVDATTNTTVNTLLAQLDDVSKQNKKRTDYYEHKRKLEQISEAVPGEYARIGLVLGWASKAIDFLARRCGLNEVAWPIGTEGEQQWKNLQKANYFKAEIAKAVSEALLYGVAFLVATAASAEEQADGAPPVLMHAVSPLNATGQWNPRLRRLDNLLVINDRDKQGKITDLTLHLPGRLINATRAAYGRWEVTETPHEYGMLAEALIYRPRSGKPLGTSRLTRAMMAHQDQGVREIIRLEGHMDIYSFPELWLLGADVSLFENNPNWRNGAARGKAIPDAEDAEPSLARVQVVRLEASNPDPHIKNLNAAAKLFAREAALPDSALSVTDYANPTSAEAYDSSQYELIHEAEGATEGFEPAVIRIAAKMIQMAGIEGDTTQLTPVWRNPRHLARSAEADAGVKQISAAPWLAETELGLELLGLTPDQISRAKAEKQATQTKALTLALLEEKPANNLPIVE